MNSPWLRKLIVTLSPPDLDDKQPGGTPQVAADAQSVEFLCDGTPNNLKIGCNVNKTINGHPSPSSVSIHNLSYATRNSILRSLSKITIKAGWENVKPETIFHGSIISCRSDRSGSDIVTNIQAVQGYEALAKANISTTFEPDSEVKDAVKDLASKLPALTVNDSDIVGIKGKFGASGWSFAGLVRDALTQLGGEKGFSWSVDNGVFRALGDTAAFEGQLKLSGKDGGLISVSPIVEGPMQVQTGVNIRAIYLPGAKPGANVSVQSTLAAGLDGTYRIHSVRFSLDPFSDSWDMDIEAFKNTPGASSTNA